MGLFELYNDPFGKRYKRRSWGDTLGTTRLKKRINRALFGPFRALSPRRAVRNFKRRTLNRFGYNSEFAKAYRRGSWGTYVKRKIMGESAMGVIMPFQESQFHPYEGSIPYDRSHESTQASPLSRGVFGKLSKYAAPGAIAGLAVLMSRKYNLFKKLSLPAAAVKKLKQVAAATHGKVSSVYKNTRGALSSHFKDKLAELKSYANKKVASVKGRTVKAKRRNYEARLRKSMESCAIVTMPFSESFQTPAHIRFHSQHEEKPGLASKVIAAGALAATGYGLYRFGRLLGKPITMAKRAETSKRLAIHYGKKAKGVTDTFSPINSLKHEWHKARGDFYTTLGAVTSPFRSNKTIEKANKAALGVIAKFQTHDPMNLRKRLPGISRKFAKSFSRRVKTEGWNSDLAQVITAKQAEHKARIAAGNPKGHWYKAWKHYAGGSTAGDWKDRVIRTVQQSGGTINTKTGEIISGVVHGVTPTVQPSSSSGVKFVYIKPPKKLTFAQKIAAYTPRKFKATPAAARRGRHVPRPMFGRAPRLTITRRQKQSAAFPVMPFREALAGSLAAQTSHTVPALSGPVASLALHYGLDWSGDAAYDRIKKHKRIKKVYDKVFKSKNPGARPGKFVSDLTSLGGTAAGVAAAEKILRKPASWRHRVFGGNAPASKKEILAKIALGVAGHTAGRFAGNAVGKKVNRVLYGSKHNKSR